MPKRVLVFIPLALSSTPAWAADGRAVAIVEAGIAAQGGQQALRAIRTIAWETVGYRNQLEQSERPEGPYITEFRMGTELHDQADHRWGETADIAVYPAYKVHAGVVVADGVAMRIAGERRGPGSPDMIAYAREKLAFSPERLLLTARDAQDLSAAPDVVMQGVRHRVVRFTFDGAPVTVYLNADTRLPTAWDYIGPLAHHGFWNYLGDVVLRTTWSFWWIGKNGVRLPMQWQTQGNGMPDTMTSVRKVTTNGVISADELSIPAEVKSAFDPNADRSDLEAWPLGDVRRPAVAIAPDVVLIPGSWNVTLVRQEDGVVIIEAPISSGYSTRVIAEARRRYPGLPIKAVVTTSDSWPHLAGIREYAARGIPIYALERNRSVIERVLSDRRTSKPDALSRAPRPARFH